MTIIFLSHSSEDWKLAHELKEQIGKETEIELEDIFVSSEPEAIPNGDWLSNVLRHLDEADIFLALITPLSEKSMWVAFEYGYFWGQKDKEKIFVLYHPKAIIPSPLNTLQAKLITEANELHVFLKVLCQSLGKKYAQRASIESVIKIALETPLESLKDRELKANLIHQMGSPDNATAINAVRELRRFGWLMDGSLRGKIFTEANLQGAPLSHADLQGAKLNWANLQEVDFIEANLKDTDLGGSRFQKISDDSPRAATFWYANLENAILGSAILWDVELGGANMKGVDLREAKLVGAKTQETQFDERTILPDGKNWTTDSDLQRFTKRIFVG